jgi:UDP-3-O-[3-hydroxymyristoyl] glucosamine N-acyltransferase
MESISIDRVTAVAGSALSLKQKCDVIISQVTPPERANSNSLVFISKKELFDQAVNNQACALIIAEPVYEAVKANLPSNACVWTTSNIHVAMSVVLKLFDKVKPWLQQGVHPQASIHLTAQVSAKAHIGAFAVIEAYAVIGDDSIIFPHVYIGPYCEIGARCQIGPHVSIGADGFGFTTDKTFHHHKIPQIGKVVIEDDCELGAFCAVDRATLTETRIKKGSKFDNFCHIAHNVQVGENAMVAAGFIVAGSTIIGKNLMTSGGVHALGHLKIADNVILTARAGVLQDVEQSGMYGGYPLEPHRESLKTLTAIPQLKSIRKQVNKILNHLNLKAEE